MSKQTSPGRRNAAVLVLFISRNAFDYNNGPSITHSYDTENLTPIYQNRAARDFCAVWGKGPEEAQLMNATSPIPSEILDRWRLLKEQWARAQPRMLSGPQTGFKEEQVHHPRSPHLRATLHLKQLSSAGVAQPHFLIECEEQRRRWQKEAPCDD